jgi:site-specific DNA-cytosine methylase
MRELALFAGAGGGILGGKLLGWQTVCAVEINPYCQRVLMQRQDDGMLEPFPIWGDITTFDGRPWAGLIDVISGGFPCQDISAAGSGAGITGERSGLWTEMARIIREVRPQHVLVENSPMLTSRGLGVVLGDLAKLRYDARWGVFSAAGVGAPHLRKRIWIRAYANGERQLQHSELHSEPIGSEQQAPRRDDAGRLCPDVPDALRIGPSEGRPEPEEIGGGYSLPSFAAKWPTPQARDYRTGQREDSVRRLRKEEAGWSPNLNDVAAPGGQLNPMFVEWLMGFPAGWTELKPLEMRRFQQWLSAHGRH